MELTAKDFTAQLAAKGYTPGIDFAVDNGDEPNTVKLTGAITFNGADGFMDFRDAEEYHGITCAEYEDLAMFTKTYELTEEQVKQIETDGEPGNDEQEEKFFEAWSAALDGIGIDLNDIKVSSR